MGRILDVPDGAGLGESRVLIRVLGPVSVMAGGRAVAAGKPQQCLVLAALAVDAGRAVPVDTLIDRVWGATPPGQVRRTLHTHIARIRRLLEQASNRPVPLVHRAGGYLLDVDRPDVDMHRFTGLVAAAGDPACPAPRQAQLLRDALELWLGQPFAGLTGHWAEHIREACVQQRLEAVVKWSEAEISLGNPTASLGTLTELHDEHPLVERLASTLIRTLHAAGRTAQALKCYTAVRERLVQELGIEPGSELQQTHRAVLRGGETGIAADTVPAQLPRDLPGFCGRAKELAQLDALLSGAGRLGGMVLLSGTAGVGKTVLAVHWAHKVRSRYPDGQLYFNLRGFDPSAPAMNPAEALRSFLDALGVPAQRVPHGQEAQAALYRSLLADKQVLVLLDNAAEADQVRPLLPGSAGCLTVVTSRASLSGLVATEAAQPVRLDVLTPSEARRLLITRLGRERVNGAPQAVDDIIIQCGRLPLALAVVAARASLHPQLPLAAIAAELRDTPQELDAFAGNDPTTDLRAVFGSSYRQLSPANARLFRLLGLHPGPDLSHAAAASLVELTPDDVHRHLAELTHAHMISESTPDRYAFHDLLRAYAREQSQDQDTETEQRQAWQRLVSWYLHSALVAIKVLHPRSARLDRLAVAIDTSAMTLPPVADARQWLQTERPNLVAVIQRASLADDPVPAWHLADALHFLYQKENHVNDWITISEAGLHAARRQGDLAGQAAMLHSLGGARWSQQDYPGACTHLLESVQIWRKLGNRPEEALVLNALAMVSGELGHLHEATAYLGQALALVERRGDPQTKAALLCNLGNMHARLGRLPVSLGYTRKALRIAQRLGNQHMSAIYLGNLAETYLELGQHQQAERIAVRSLRLARHANFRGTEACSRICFAEILAETGRHQQALTHAQAALAVARDLGNQRIECDALIALGHANLPGNPTDAEGRFTGALGMAESVGYRLGQARAAIGRANARAFLGHYEQAVADGGLAARVADEAGFRLIQGQALTATALAHNRAGQQHSARVVAEQALAIHRETGHLPGLAATERLLGEKAAGPALVD